MQLVLAFDRLHDDLIRLEAKYTVNKVIDVFACHFDEGLGREAVSSSEIFLETAATSKISTQRALL